MGIKIALAGNPNSGKTTLFNALTGSNQFVGNWPGVTVEKKEGRLKDQKDVTITDLPGIYSLSPYTLEEVVARNYLIHERPEAILNIVDGTNLEVQFIGVPAARLYTGCDQEIHPYFTILAVFDIILSEKRDLATTREILDLQDSVSHHDRTGVYA